MPQDIDRSRLQHLMIDGAAVVEVLPTEEFELEHLPGAISLPLTELRSAAATRAVGSDTRRPIVVYCQSVD